MIKTIYVDMDGVLCDYLKRFTGLFKVEPERDYPSTNKAKEAYKQQFKDFIAGDNFATLDPIPDFDLAMQFLTSIENDYTIKLLTSTAKLKYLTEVTRQKHLWLVNHGIKWPVILVPGKKLKQYYARPDSLLIDDTESNVLEWRERYGKAILHTSWKQTIEEFKKYYE
jgi:hypothetical protein